MRLRANCYPKGWRDAEGNSSSLQWQTIEMQTMESISRHPRQQIHWLAQKGPGHTAQKQYHREHAASSQAEDQ